MTLLQTYRSRRLRDYCCRKEGFGSKHSLSTMVAKVHLHRLDVLRTNVHLSMTIDNAALIALD